VVAAGINGKMSEINAAFGLLQLKGIDAARAQRRAIDARYRQLLADLPGIHCLPAGADESANHAYFPILVGPDYPLTRDALFAELRRHEIYARRYFYPLISDFPMYRDMPSAAPARLPVAQRASSQVICLPIYPGLADDIIAAIVAVIAAQAALPQLEVDSH